MTFKQQIIMMRDYSSTMKHEILEESEEILSEIISLIKKIENCTGKNDLISGYAVSGNSYGWWDQQRQGHRDKKGLEKKFQILVKKYIAGIKKTILCEKLLC
jgi:predicted  nucleic acid-binding Zn ribbon protein